MKISLQSLEQILDISIIPVPYLRSLIIYNILVGWVVLMISHPGGN